MFRKIILKISRVTLWSFLFIVLIFKILDLLFPLNIKLDYSKTIESREGILLYAKLNKSDKWRVKIPVSEISPQLKKAIICKEDQWFYYHLGVNPISIFRASINNLIKAKRTSGASTIDMQVIRLLYPAKRNFLNKIIEAFRAIQLNFIFSKEEILELYLNHVPYGGNIEGIRTASLIYLNKEPALLSPAEITLLCTVPNKPSSLNLSKNSNLIELNRNIWLERFKDEGVFTENDYLSGKDEPILLKRNTLKTYAPHFAERIFKKEINNSNPNFKSSLSLNTQLKSEKILYQYISRIKNLGISQGAVLVVDNSSGEILSYVGSYDFNDAASFGQVDGIKAIRSPGSTLKPLVYGLGIDLGIITPKSMIKDVPSNFDGFTPENFNKKYNGLVSVEFALSNSLNIPAVDLLDKIGVNEFLRTAIKSGFKSFIKQKKKLGLSVALGGCGTSLEELVQFYAGLSVLGKRVELKYHYDPSSPQGNIRFLSKEAAFLINQILSIQSRPDFPNAFSSTIRIPKIYWKTGTSFGKKDAWSIGFNHKYTIGVWVGNFSGEGNPFLSGAEIATPLLFQIFNQIDYNSSNKGFEYPKNLQIREVCSETGLVPGSFCNNLIQDFFIEGKSATHQCEHLIKITCSKDLKYSFCSSCENLYSKEKADFQFPNISPEIIAYYESHQIKYQKIPPHYDQCTRIFENGNPQISSPVNNMEYLLEKDAGQKISLTANCPSDVKKVFWYVNNQLIGQSVKNKAFMYQAQAGVNQISCVDDRGRSSNIRIIVKYY